MNNSVETSDRSTRDRAISKYPIFTIAVSLAAIVVTYLLANSGFEVGAKTRGFSVIVVSFLSVSTLLYFRHAGRRSPDTIEASDNNNDTERQLAALDEANEFFAGSLGSSDTFRLIANRVQRIVPFRTIALLLLDKTRTHLTIAEVEGRGADRQRGRTISFDDGLVGKSFYSQMVAFGNEQLSTRGYALPSAAIPLMHGMEVFGILHLHFDKAYELEKIDSSVFEAICVRAAPLILSSIAFEQSRKNALTDLTTDLPNERAFYLILEIQIAETARKLNERPLAILAIDIKNFEDINRKYGHAAGDRALKFVAQIVKDNLRQMDFFARSINDEFLAILPTASTEISQEVIARIQTDFLGRKLQLLDSNAVEIDLNIGWAAFGDDGDTTDQLLAVARLRKNQSKSAEPGKVLWFAQERVN